MTASPSKPETVVPVESSCVTSSGLSRWDERSLRWCWVWFLCRDTGEQFQTDPRRCLYPKENFRGRGMTCYLYFCGLRSANAPFTRCRLQTVGCWWKPIGELGLEFGWVGDGHSPVNWLNWTTLLRLTVSWLQMKEEGRMRKRKRKRTTGERKKDKSWGEWGRYLEIDHQLWFSQAKKTRRRKKKLTIAWLFPPDTHTSLSLSLSLVILVRVTEQKKKKKKRKLTFCPNRNPSIIFQPITLFLFPFFSRWFWYFRNITFPNSFLRFLRSRYEYRNISSFYTSNEANFISIFNGIVSLSYVYKRGHLWFLDTLKRYQVSPKHGHAFPLGSCACPVLSSRLWGIRIWNCWEASHRTISDSGKEKLARKFPRKLAQRTPHQKSTAWPGHVSRLVRKYKPNPDPAAVTPCFMSHVHVHLLFTDVKNLPRRKSSSATADMAIDTCKNSRWDW